MRILISIKLVCGDFHVDNDKDLWYGYSSPISVERIVDNNQVVIKKILSEFPSFKTYLKLNAIKEEKEKNELLHRVFKTGNYKFRTSEILNPQQFYIDKEDQQYFLIFTYSIEDLPGISPSNNINRIRQEEKKQKEEEEEKKVSNNNITTATQENKEELESDFEEVD